MGNATSQPTNVCTLPPNTKQHEYRPPWALAQADSFEHEDCPFCALRRSHCSWLNTEIKRLASEMSSIETTIPPRFHADLQERLTNPLPDSRYTGGVDDVTGSACPKCVEARREVMKLQREANALDSHCKARIEFHQQFACRIEALLIEKRTVEESLYFKHPNGGDSSAPRTNSSTGDVHFCAITKVNQPDEDAAEAHLHATPRQACYA